MRLVSVNYGNQGKVYGRPATGGRLLSNGFLFDLALKAACTAAGLLDATGRPTLSAHRFRHIIGTSKSPNAIP